MRNLDYNVLERIMKIYEKMPTDQKKVMDTSASESWQEAFREYNRLCTSDDELVAMQKEIYRIESVLRFDMEEHFPASRRGMTYHDVVTYDEAKELADNWAVIKAELEHKIEKAEKSIFHAFNKTKIEELRKELRDKKYIVQNFNACCQKQQAKIECQKTLDQVYEPLKKRYEQKIARYSRKVVKKCIEANPFVICKKHKVIYTASNGEIGTSTRVMNEVCNAVTDKVARQIAKQDKAQQQNTQEQETPAL